MFLPIYWLLIKASKRHYKSDSIQFKQEGSVVYSVGLIFGGFFLFFCFVFCFVCLLFFFTAVISAANWSGGLISEGPLFATLGLRGLSRDVCQVHCGTFWGDAFLTVANIKAAVYGVSRHCFRFSDREEKEQSVLHWRAKCIVTSAFAYNVTCIERLQSWVMFQ